MSLACLAVLLALESGVQHAFPAAPIRHVDVRNGNGDVTVSGTDAATATVTATITKGGPECRPTAELKGDTLVVASKDQEADLGKGCHLRLQVALPRTASVDVKVGAGDVKVDGFRSDVAYEVGTGNVTVGGSRLGELKGRTGSGQVRVAGSLDQAELKIGAGSADIALDKAPPRGHLDVRIGTGSATIRLPKDSKVKSTFKSGLGSMTNEFPPSREGAFTVSGSAGAGDLTIRRS